MSEAESKRIFQKKFRELLEERHLSQKEIAKICNVSTSTVSTWYKGINIPRMNKIERLANYFGLTKSYFIEDSETMSSATPDDIKAAFWGGDKDLSQDDLDAMWADVKRFADFVAQKKKQEKQGND